MLSSNLYEHQSIWNPNMPLQGLFYFSDSIRGMSAARQLDLYSSVQLRLSVTRYMTRKEPRRRRRYACPLPLRGQTRVLYSLESLPIIDCLEEGVLVEYLTKHRSEITMSILTEYNEEQVLKNRFKEGREAGIAEGKEAGITEGRTQKLLSQICRKIKKGKTVEQIAEELEEDIAVIF